MKKHNKALLICLAILALAAIGLIVSRSGDDHIRAAELCRDHHGVRSLRRIVGDPDFPNRPDGGPALLVLCGDGTAQAEDQP